MDFDNLHQVLRNLYQEMMPLCGDMIGVAKGIAGLGALFYVAYRVWKALASAEPIDVFPLLRPFAIGLCVMFFPTVVLGTINAVMSPVVQGTHAILEGQTLDLQAYQQQKDDLEAEARRREGKAWLVDDEVYEQRLADMGITDLGEIISMWAERTWYDIKAGFRQLVRDFFELLFNAAGLTIDTLRTFFLVVLSILGPLSFALSIYDGFHSTLASWISRYISVYLWLPIADLFSAVLAKIQTLMLQADVLALQDPNYIPDSGSGVYIIFLIIGIIGYFTIPTVAEWVIQSGGAGGAMGGINKAGAFATGVAGGIAGNMIGRTFGRRGGGGSSSGNGGGGPASGSAPTGATWQHKVTVIIHNNLDNGIQVIKKHRNKFQADSAFRYRVPLPVRAGIRVQRGRELPFRRKAAREDLRPGRGQVADAGAIAGFEPEPPRGGARTYPAFSRVVLYPLARPCGHREQHQPRAVPGR